MYRIFDNIHIPCPSCTRITFCIACHTWPTDLPLATQVMSALLLWWMHHVYRTSTSFLWLIKLFQHHIGIGIDSATKNVIFASAMLLYCLMFITCLTEQVFLCEALTTSSIANGRGSFDGSRMVTVKVLRRDADDRMRYTEIRLVTLASYCILCMLTVVFCNRSVTSSWSDSRSW